MKARILKAGIYVVIDTSKEAEVVAILGDGSAIINAIYKDGLPHNCPEHPSTSYPGLLFTKGEYEIVES